MSRGRLVLALALAACSAPPSEVPNIDPQYVAAIAEFRAEREQRLRSPDGWLTLSGLHWLRPGENAIGNDPDAAVPLLAEGLPADVGTLVLEGEQVTLRVAAGSRVELDGEPVTERVLRDDSAEEGPDVLVAGRLRFQVIRRGERVGVRVKDPEHPRLASFRGLDHFPLNPAFRVAATLEPFEAPREIEIGNVVGTTSTMLVPGVVRFSLAGRELTLQPLVTEPGDAELWFIFKDATSGKESYGFRYLTADLAEGGRVDLDFNRAYNPPCAFSPHATCPLPPRQNQLDLRVEAGERAFAEH